MFNKNGPTEYMVIQEEVLERVNGYVYLAQLVQTNLSLEPEIRRHTNRLEFFRKEKGSH